MSNGDDYVDTALDLLYPGSPTEVYAHQYANRSYSMRDRRFICTVCGEYVALTINGHFRHGNKTEYSFCEKRVDSKNSGNRSIQYRVGLPIYLRRFDLRCFRLYMGFYALSNHDMSLFSNSSSSVCIKDPDEKYQPMIYSLNNENFSCIETRLIPLHFIPKRNYKITITNNVLQRNSDSIWSDYADTMSQDGALFSHHTNGGRKIRRGDSIETNTEYYLVTQSTPIEIKGISLRFEGQINLQSKQLFQVYTVEFNGTADKFKNLRDYCLAHFKVNLVYKKPRIIPLWPPVIQHNGVDMVLGSQNIIASVDSQNLSSKVYIHNGKFCKEEKCIILDRNIKYLKLPHLYTDSDIAVTVDRRFSLETTLFRAYCKVPMRNYSVTFKSNGQIIDNDECVSPTLDKITHSMHRDVRVDTISGDGSLRVFSYDQKIITGVTNRSIIVVSKICSVTKIVPLRKIKFIDERLYKQNEGCLNFRNDPTVGCMLVLPSWAEVFIKNNIMKINFKDKLLFILSTKTISLNGLREIASWRDNNYNDRR